MVHAQAQGSFLCGAVVARELSAALVVTSHETLPFQDKLGAARSNVLYTLPEVDLVIAGSRFFAEQAAASGVSADRIRLVPYGLPLPVERATHTALPGATVQDPLRLASVGRFKPRKNQLALVESVHLLRRQAVHVYCTMIGRTDASSKEYHDDVLAAVAELELDDHVEVLSSVDDGERARLLIRSHLVVQPARHEGFGFAALEAVLGQRITILAPNTGYRDLVGADSLFLAAAPSATALADKVRDVLARPDRYMAELERLHAMCVERHTDRKSAEATAAAYRDVLADRRSAMGCTPDLARLAEGRTPVAPSCDGESTRSAVVSDGPRFSIVVTTHPKRRYLAERLVDAHPELNMTIVVDPAPDGPPGSFRTARAGWAAVGEDATHHLVLQDDVELCADFLTALRIAVATRPDAAISLFTEWGARTSYVLRIAALTNRAWAQVIDTYVPSQGLVLPAPRARSADDHLADAEARAEPDDQAMLAYLERRSVDRYAVLPNLVQHRDVSSVVGNDAMGPRLSVWYQPAGPGPDELARLARTDEVRGIEPVPYFSWTEGAASFCLRPADGTGEWTRVPALDVSTRRGLSAADLATGCAHALAALADEEKLRDRVSAILLHQLWLVGVAVGMRVAELTAGAMSPQPLSNGARHAVSTLGPGALRRFIPPQHIAATQLALEPFVWAAIRFGSERPVAVARQPVRM